MLASQSSAEIEGWLAYLDMDDEVQRIQMARAIVLALGGEKPAPDDEEVIDSTSTDFAQNFKGFIGGNEIKGG